MQHFLIQLATSVLLLALASGFPRFDGPPQDSNNRRGGQQGGQQGRFHPPGNPGYGFQRRLPYPAPGPPPDFLREDVSDRSRDEYFQMLERDEDKSKGELKTELAKWADKSGVKEEFDKFMIEHEEKRKDYHDLVANNLAGDALTAFEKIWKITQNDKLSRGAECQQIGAVLEGLKNKVRQLVPLIDPQIMGPPASGCFQPGPEEEDQQQQYQQQEQRQRGEQQQQRGGIHQSNKGNNKKDKNGRKEDVEEEDREN